MDLAEESAVDLVDLSFNILYIYILLYCTVLYMLMYRTTDRGISDGVGDVRSNRSLEQRIYWWICLFYSLATDK